MPRRKRKETLQRYEAVIRGYQRLIDRLPTLRQELDSIVDSNGSFTKRQMQDRVSEVNESILIALKEQTESQYRLLRRPLVGLLTYDALGINEQEYELEFHKNMIQEVEDYMREKKQ